MRDEKRKGELMREEEETACNKQRWLTIKTCRGCLPGGRELVNYCWEEARWAAPLPGCWCDCRNEGTVGVQVSSGERLSVDLELLHRPPPRAIIHSTWAPHEADDGCLACGPSSPSLAWDNRKKGILWRTAYCRRSVYFWGWFSEEINIKQFTSLILPLVWSWLKVTRGLIFRIEGI